jgi:hypothetical protein
MAVIVVCILLIDAHRRSRPAPPCIRRSDEVRKSCEMITAYVLIQTEVGKAGQVASAAAEIDGVDRPSRWPRAV